MTLGIKVGPQSNSLANLDESQAPFCEVWFNIAKADEYQALFAGIKERHVIAGLHYWGALADGTWTNIAYPDRELIKESMDLMRETIDIAARHNFVYVNIHPGARAKVAIDFERQSFKLLSEPIAVETAEAIFLENAQILSEYAKSRGVTFTVETVPARVTDGWFGQDVRLHPLNIYEMPSDSVAKYAARGYAIAQDFGHTASSIISDDRSVVKSYLTDMVHKMAAQTRLIHLGFVVAPFNGTDFHDMLDNPIYNTDNAIPNYTETIELLRIFKQRSDIWILVEPREDHPKNYRLAQELLSHL